MNKYFSNTAFVDLLFNIVVGIAFLFIVAFLLINPISKKNDVKSKADYLIIMEWQKESIHDIDTWIRDPLGELLSFRHKDVGFMHLDRDDLGTVNDKVLLPNGQEISVQINKETAALRGTLEGWYVVNVHAYRKRKLYDKTKEVFYNDKLKVNVKLIRVNPYKVVVMHDLVLEHQGQEFTAFQFKLDKKGKVIEVRDERVKLVTLKYGSAGGEYIGQTEPGF
jgi:hypothetical protein